MRDSTIRGLALALICVAEAGCGDDSTGVVGLRDYVVCGAVECQPGFHCEFDACVADAAATPQQGGVATSPLVSERHVFSLQKTARRLIRIDGETLDVRTFAAGLQPVDLAIIGDRELSLVLDGLDVLEVLDHRAEPPHLAAWSTARELSHVVVAPGGKHAVAYYDWDDPRSAERQPGAGNINQVTVVDLADAATPMSDADTRASNVTVGFLPRAIRFSNDGAKLVVIAQSSITVVDLGQGDDLARPVSMVGIDGSASEVLIDSGATTGVLRYPDSGRVDVVDLASGAVTCLQAPGVVHDVALSLVGALLVSSQTGPDGFLSVADFTDAAEVCAPLAQTHAVRARSQIAVSGTRNLAVAFVPDHPDETVTTIDLELGDGRELSLEKRVAAGAFVGDGVHALVTHTKSPGEPLWDPGQEPPEVSVDKSFGLSWVNLITGGHRLAVSEHPFGQFAFVETLAGSATYVAVRDPADPSLLRVEHAPGFDDSWIALAGMPLDVGVLPAASAAFATQEHPWGRVTFVQPNTGELRHVTGFALESR